MGISILAIGGSTRPNSTSEQVLHIAAAGAQAVGATVSFVCGRDLMLPIYDTETDERTDQARALVEAMRTADGFLVSSPGYHGGVSGLVKNALDYAEDLRQDPRPYFDGRAVGCIAVAHGWQATVSTLHQLRQIAHALRGWPTPLGASLNAMAMSLTDEAVVRQLETIGRQVAEFARMRHAHSG